MASTFLQPFSDEYIEQEASRQISRPTKVEKVHISDVRPFDTVFHQGKVQTVCIKDIKRDSFVNHTLFGDSYVLGLRPVHRLIMGLL